MPRKAAFNGAPEALETVLDTATTYTAPADQAAVGTTRTLTKDYSVPQPSTLVTRYGSVVDVKSSVASSYTTIYAVPPEQDTRWALASGQSATWTRTQKVTAIITLQGTPVSSPEQTVTTTVTVTYLGQESVTVPAGTFMACKFQTVTSNAGDGTSLDWLMVGKGVSVRSVTGAGTSSQTVMELLPTSRLNGSAF